MGRNFSREGSLRIASIDIGTNTILLLIADIDSSGKIFTVEDILETPRLGEGSHGSGLISARAIERTTDTLKKYREHAREHRVDSTVVCGTSALREAGNRDEVLDAIRSQTGYEIAVLEGHEEALLSFRGTLGTVRFSADRIAVIDIGGGSTELAYYSKNEFRTHSFPLGAVRLTELYLKNNPPGSDRLARAVQHIRDNFDKTELEDLRGKNLVGVAGTPTTLACLDQNLADFDRFAVDGYRLTNERVRHWQKILSSRSPAEIRKLSRTTAGREDILAAGATLLYEFMNKWKFESVTVSVRGLRYGLLLREWDHRK